MRAVVLSPWGAVSDALSVSDVYLTYLTPSSFTFLSIFSPCCCSAQKEAQVMRQWGRSGRMRCSGKEECGSRNGKGVGGREQRMQRQRGSPLPLPLLLLSHFLLMLQAHMSLELGSSVGNCPRTSAHTSWPQFSFRGGERALEVPSYLLKKCGLVSWEQNPQTFCDEKHPGSELLPCSWLQSDLAQLFLLGAPPFPHL